jgi:hypothetical protein
MDNEQSRPNDVLDLSLQGIAIRPGSSSSRASSTRKNSQTKQPSTPTSSREGDQYSKNKISNKNKNLLFILGSAKERKASLSTSANFSSARQR